jgi:VWFA-related protein
MRAGAALLLTGLFLVPCLAAGARPEPPPAAPPTFEGSISVALDTLIVRVVDGSGRPIPGLTPEDFRVRVHGREIAVAAVDWVSSETAAGPGAERPALPEGAAPAAAAEAATAPGKLIVVFVQADLEPTRISGQMRLRPYMRDMLTGLPAADRIAVVSFDSHLKLWLDFTGDREAALGAIDRAMIYSQETDVLLADPPSLARHFDFAAARDVASPERALAETAKALTELLGEKTLLMLGWGLGRYGMGGVTMTPDYRPAVAALSKARVSVFVLDVTSADSHSLEVGLQSVADATGGSYERTFQEPGVAVRRIARAISGWYVLTFERDALDGVEPGKLTVELRGRRGEVLVRPVIVR